MEQEPDSAALPRDTDRLPAAVWWLTFLFVVVGAAAVFWGVSQQQNDLTARTQQALAAAGFVDVDVHYAGRDATLRGTVPSDPGVGAAEDLVLNLRGVRTVDGGALATVAMAEEPEPPTTGEDRDGDGALVTVSFTTNQAVVSGVLPDRATADVVVASAEAQFGGGNVMDEIAIQGGEVPAWATSLPAIVDSLGGLESGIVTVAFDGVRIEGVAPNGEAAATTIASLESASTLPVVAALDVRGSATLSAEAADDAISVTGTLPNQGDVDRIVAAAEANYSSVANDLTIGLVDRPDWIPRIPDLIATTADWPSWELAIGGTAAAFRGVAPDYAAAEALQNEYQAPLGLAPEGVIVEIDPAAVALGLTELLQGTGTFGPGSATLSADAAAVLDEVIVVLAANPSTTVIVEGHTDDQGSAAGNLALSQERAEAVVAYLVDGGIAAVRLSAVGYGEDQPIADNDTPEGRAMNRRIEFVVESEGGG